MKGLFREEVGAGAEKLAELDHESPELEGGNPKGRQDSNQRFGIGSSIEIATLMGTPHSTTLAMDNPDRPQQQPRNSQKAASFS
ncbi:MAG: hypothetical protein ACHQ7M_03300 [Chloroflexota bacterium]